MDRKGRAKRQSGPSETKRSVMSGIGEDDDFLRLPEDNSKDYATDLVVAPLTQRQRKRKHSTHVVHFL